MRLHHLLILLLSTAVATAQQNEKQTLGQLKESTSGQRIIWFLNQVLEGNSVDEGEIRKHFSEKLIEKVGADKLADMITQLSADQGVLYLYKAVRKTETEYQLMVKGKKTGEWFDMAFYFTPNDLITGIAIDSSIAEVAVDRPIYPLENN